MGKKVLKGTGITLALILLAALLLIGWLTVTEYKPEPVEAVEVAPGEDGKTLAPGGSLVILSQNTGYAGLGKEEDFFMDGGSGVRPTREEMEQNLEGIKALLLREQADVYFLQEVDPGSSRTSGIDQRAVYHRTALPNYASAYALNYSCDFVPYPLPPIGRVHSGVQTLSALAVRSAERVALPCPFSWPVSAANLKRCLLVSYVPLQDTDKELVLVNLHLEAYDDGEGKAAQTKQLMDLLCAEYEKGNYVIAGGDFNQTFPGALEAYPIKDASLWTPGTLENSILPEGWQFAYDLAAPSCRLLNQPYDPASAATQFYVIDGFILSPNIRLDVVKTLDEQFTYTDHNPVKLAVTLQ